VAAIVVLGVGAYGLYYVTADARRRQAPQPPAPSGAMVSGQPAGPAPPPPAAPAVSATPAPPASPSPAAPTAPAAPETVTAVAAPSKPVPATAETAVAAAASSSPATLTAGVGAASGERADAGSDAEIDRLVAEQIPDPVVKPLAEIVGHWRSVPASAFPKSVTLRDPLSYAVHAGGRVVGRGQLPAGSPVVPLALKDGILTIAPSSGSADRASVAVDQTNFKALIEERYDTFVRTTAEKVQARRASLKRRLVAARTKEEALARYGDGRDPRFEPMKQSLRQGGAGVFQIEGADRWRWGGRETIDGVEYETGLVTMVNESAFGSTERELKALMREGKVVRWVDAATDKPL
jgi:hypothetical protein